MHVSVDRLPASGRRVLAVVVEMAGPGRPVWLVGGALREMVSGRAARDLDLTVAGGALGLGRRVADRLDAAFVVLDATRGAGRVVGRSGDVALDLVDLRAPTLEGDLRARDFTVNALAAPIGDLLGVGRAEIVDPTGGLGDLERGLVQVCAPAAITEDPVRALRGVRLAMRAGWRLTPDTERAIAEGAPRVAGVSSERVRDELIGILSEATAAAGLRALDRLGVLPVLLPESGAMRITAQPLPHHFDVWEHSLCAVEGVDTLLADLDALAPWGASLREHLAETLGGGLTRREVLKLAALLHDVSKPETRRLDGDRVRFIGHDALGAGRTRAVAERLRLPRRAGQVLERLVAAHLRPMHLAQTGTVTRRARFRFFRDLGDDARDVLLLSLADAAALTGASPLAVWAGAGGELVRALLADVEADSTAADVPALLRGEDVMAAFGLGPGPEVGRLLARAREAQALGQVTTREEALEYLRRGPRDGET